MGRGWAAGKHFRVSPSHTPSTEVRGVGVRGAPLFLRSIFLPLLLPVLERNKSIGFNEPEMAIVKTAPFDAQL